MVNVQPIATYAYNRRFPKQLKFQRYVHNVLLTINGSKLEITEELIDRKI